MPTLDTLHVDEALTNISIAYRNEAFVAEQLLPVVPVQKRRDIYFKFSKQHFVAEDDTYYPGSHAKRIEVDLEKRGYYDAHGHALEAIIPDEFRENADPGAKWRALARNVSGSRRQRRAAAIGSVKGRSPAPTGMGKMRRKRPFRSSRSNRKVRS